MRRGSKREQLAEINTMWDEAKPYLESRAKAFDAIKNLRWLFYRGTAGSHSHFEEGVSPRMSLVVQEQCETIQETFEKALRLARDLKT